MDEVYSRSPEFVQRDVAGECLLVPIRRGPGGANSIYVLNPVAADVWRRLDGKSAISQVLDGLTAEYDVEPARLRADVATLVADLLSIEAIAPARP